MVQTIHTERLKLLMNYNLFSEQRFLEKHAHFVELL